ncbi:MAG: hypothetical protein WBD36_02015, partial [Bacteroidota bacterium]
QKGDGQQHDPYSSIKYFFNPGLSSSFSSTKRSYFSAVSNCEVITSGLTNPLLPSLPTYALKLLK